MGPSGLAFLLLGLICSSYLAASDIDECALQTTCPALAKCINIVGSYRCECPIGYFLKEDGSSCNLDIDLCELNPCLDNISKCTEEGQGFANCICHPGYVKAEFVDICTAFLLVVVVVSTIGGAALIALITAVIVLSVRKHSTKGDVFTSASNFRMSYRAHSKSLRSQVGDEKALAKGGNPYEDIEPVTFTNPAYKNDKSSSSDVYY
ncbi:unnamed protein product [Lampetra fluviatilis]